MCCKAINGDQGRCKRKKLRAETFSNETFFSLSLYAAYAVPDYSFGTLVGLGFVCLCGLRLLQLHHHESGEHNEFERRIGDFAGVDSNRNGPIWNKTNDGVVPAVHQHRTCPPVYETRTRALDFT